MTINWRERVYAAVIHFLVTLVVTGLVGALIFFIWFPGPMAAMIRGTDLFLLVFSIDLALGPLMSLVVYSSKKARRLLIIDYSVIGAVQLAALVYGVFIVSVSRPVFVAFDMSTTRLEIVSAIDFDDAHLAAAKEEQFRSLPWWGPKLASIIKPTDEEMAKIIEGLFSGGGADVPYLPKYYREYDTARQEILDKSLPLAVLVTDSGSAKAAIDSAVAATGKSNDDVRWLLVHHRFGFGVALIDAKTTKPIKYLALDPTWVNASYKLNRLL
jgi:hypothetical protein